MKTNVKVIKIKFYIKKENGGLPAFVERNCEIIKFHIPHLFFFADLIYLY